MGWLNIPSKTQDNIQKPQGQSQVGAHLGLPPRILDILSRFFGNILSSSLANIHILLQSSFSIQIPNKSFEALENWNGPSAGRIRFIIPFFHKIILKYCLVSWGSHPNLSTTGGHTYSAQNIMKFGGEEKWVLLRVCKQYFSCSINRKRKYCTI